MTGPEDRSLDAPIFIVGAERSGTTLLRNMLNRHPAIAICNETHFDELVYSRRRAFGDLADPRKRHRLITEYLAADCLKRAELDLPALAAALMRDGAGYREFFASILRFYAAATKKVRAGEKTPHHAMFLETLCRWFPGALILHVLRDPRDVVASLMRMRWAPASVTANARRWARASLAAWQARHRPGYLLVRYETLVTEPEQELRRICAFAGEEYSSSMLNAGSAPDGSPPWFRRAHEPVTTERLEMWREQLTADDVALVEWAVGPQMEELGYRRVSSVTPRWRIAREASHYFFITALRHIGEFPAAWYSLTRSASIRKQEAAVQRYRRRRAVPANSSAPPAA